MNFNDTAEEAAFRTEVKAFIEQECPAGIRRRGFRAAFGGGGWDDIHMERDEYFRINGAWIQKMADRGWIAPACLVAQECAELRAAARPKVVDDSRGPR